MGVTILQACTRKLGQTRGGLAAANIAQYAIAQAELGHFPTAVEYADYWAISERTAWRHRSRCEAAFGDAWPEVVEQLAAYLVKSRERSPRSAMGYELVTA